MVNTSILGGLRIAISNGATLEQAMMSFYNAGYSKRDVEEAARVFQLEQAGHIKNIPEDKTPAGKIPGKTIKRVSDYEQDPKRKLVLILKIFLLAIILGLLIFVYLFRKEIMSFFSNLF